MKTLTAKILQFALSAATACLCTISHAQVTNTWDGGGGDGLWNTDANWLLDLTPGTGTNAFIEPGAVIVNYNSPMTATDFSTLRMASSTNLNINAGGFVASGAGNGAIDIVGANSVLSINSGGAVSLTSGGLTGETNGAVALSAGGSLSVAGALRIGNLGGASPGSFWTNYGGTLSAGSTVINPGNSAAVSQTSPAWRLVVLGGTNDLGAVTVLRSPSASGGFNNVPLGSEGLVISNGLVRMTSLDVGGALGNSWLTAFVAGGNVTNSGAFTIRAITAARASRFVQNGGVFESIGDDIHLRGRPGPSQTNVVVWYFVNGGTNIVRGFVVSDLGDIAGTVVLSNSAKIYVGSGGFSMGGSLSAGGTNVVLTSSGIFGAQTDWTGTVPMTMAGGTFDAAALDGTPHNITISGVLGGSGGFTKAGGGTLTLGASNTYSGNTLINAGTLALGASGSVANSLTVLTGSNTVFDVQAVSGGYVLPDSRTIGGFGVVTGNVTLASGAIVSPGNSPGTLTFTNNLTASGSANFKFDLPNSPGSGSNDFLIVGGTLTVSGINILEANGAGAPGTVYPLIKYGTFSGNVTNFDVSVATGVISNNASTKTLYLIVQAATRAPTNTVWAGLTSAGHGNLWDDVVTNWVTQAGGTPTIFISGDNTKFTNAGAGIQTNITLVGTLTPGSVTVDSTANYTFGSNGRISGIDSVTKSNTGTLTILTTNNYTGATIIGGGVLAANTLADGAFSSSIGAASIDPTNLVISSGTLRYLGDTVSTTRGATLEGTGTIDVTNTATTLSIAGTVTGSGILTKAGAGTLAMGPANAYSGGTVLSGGVLQMNAADSLGTGGITNNGRTLRLNGVINPLNMVEFNGNCVVDVGNPGGSDARGLVGAWSGNASVLITNMTNAGATFTIGGSGAGGGGMTNFSGTVSMGDCIGFLRFNDGGNQNFGSSNLTVDLGTGRAVFNPRNSATIEFGELRGGPSTRVHGRASGSAGTVTYQIGGKNVSCTYDGTITNSTSGNLTELTKVGNATLRLTGTNNYTGATTISSGTLQVDGELGNTLVQVNSGATLSGNGTIVGGIFANAGSIVAPGASVGTLSLTNGGMIIDGSTLAIEINKSLPLTNDSVNITNCSISVLSGSVTVTNLGPALQAGDKFVLCNQAISGGSALTVTGAGCTWQNDLETDGSITVLTAPVVANPVINSVVRSGNNIILSGTNGATSGNFIVLSSTNVATPIASWNPIATNPFNPNGTFSFTNAISFTIPKTFYRVQVQ